MAPITSTYAALLALLIATLLLRVVVLRWRHRVPLGDGGERKLLKAMRIHGNAVETLPIALLLMLLYELGGGDPRLLHGCGVALLAGRLAHAHGLSRSIGISVGRITGTVSVVSVIVVLAALLLHRSLH